MAFLGIEKSLTGRAWVGPDVSTERASEALVQHTDLPRPVCQILARMDVSADSAEPFLSPTLRDLMPDPRSLRDMETAASRLLDALEKRQKIAIFADYDVDGGSSAAVLITWLKEMGTSATLYVPDRIDEGYGPNEHAMAQLASAHDLIICVDCGTLSHGPIAAARDADVIVLDHHLGAETLPDAYAVVNPNRQDEDGALAHLCAAAVVFLALVEAGRQLRAAGKQGPDLMSMLDLVGLATVADVAPLIGVNRAFVRQGLKVMARRERVGWWPWPTLPASTPRRRHITWAICWGRGSTRVGASGKQTWEPAYWRPRILTKQRRWRTGSITSMLNGAISRPTFAQKP